MAPPVTSSLILLLAAGASSLGLPSAFNRRIATQTIIAVGGTSLGLPVFAADKEAVGSIFVGRYTDPINHPGGIRDIKLLDTNLAGFRLAEVTGGGGRGEPASFTLPAKVGMLDNGNEAITIDFSPKGGPKDFTGVFEINSDGTKGIRFLRDRNFWPMQ